MHGLSLVLAAVLCAGPTPAQAPPFLTIRLVEPKVQGERLLALFNGTKAPHPAAALAGYRHAHRGISGLSKGAEAGIAALNPRMVRELGLFNNATVEFKRRPDGKLGWNALILNDDGSLDAVGTAFALTDGLSLPPIDGATVDRLGPPGAPLLAKRGAKLIVGGAAEDVNDGLLRTDSAVPSALRSGFASRIVPENLTNANDSLTNRRILEAFRAVGAKTIDTTVALEDDRVVATVTTGLAAPINAKLAIEPDWLAIPSNTQLVAAFAFALDSSPAAWNSLFQVIDRVERVDPAYANVAPARLRLGLIFGRAKVRPDSDLYPVIQGVSGFVTGDKGKAAGALVRIHVRDELAAKKLASETLPRLIIAFRLGKSAPGEGGGFVINGKPLSIIANGRTVEVNWGSVEKANLENRPSWIKDSLTNPGVARLVAFWPEQIATIKVPAGEPVVWVGRNLDSQTRDEIRWTSLKSLVKTLVDRLEITPPPDIAVTPPEVAN